MGVINIISWRATRAVLNSPHNTIIEPFITKFCYYYCQQRLGLVSASASWKTRISWVVLLVMMEVGIRWRGKGYEN